MECKHCKKEYESISDGTRRPIWIENYYCSEQCWYNSEQYKNHIVKAEEFFNSMTRKQLDFWENEGLWEESYFKEYGDMIKKKREDLDNYVLTGRNVR